MKSAKITKLMTFSEVVAKWPITGVVFMKYGLHCIGCHAASYETIEEGCKAHGLSNKQITNLIKELNDVVANKSRALT